MYAKLNSFGVLDISYVLGENKVPISDFINKMKNEDIDCNIFGVSEIRRTDKAPLQLATEACEDVLKRNSMTINDIDLIIYSYSFFQDKFGVPPSPELSYRLGDGRKKVIDIYQACNGTIASFEQAHLFFSTYKDVENILLVTADRIPREYNLACCLSHGAAAAILNRTAPLRVISLKIKSSGKFCDLMPIQEGAIDPDNVNLRKYNLPKNPKLFTDFKIEELKILRKLLTDSLKELSIEIHDIDQFVTLNLGNYIIEDTAKVLKIDSSKVFCDNILNGHIGSADSLINLKDYTSKIEIKGKMMCLIASGTGHFWGMAYLMGS